jgi:hypothetical protein
VDSVAMGAISLCVMAGLDLAIPILGELRSPNRDRRVKPGDDECFS